MGLSFNGRTPALHAGDKGSIPLSSTIWLWHAYKLIIRTTGLTTSLARPPIPYKVRSGYHKCVSSITASIPAFQAGGEVSITSFRTNRGSSIMVSIDACQALGEGSTPSSHTKRGNDGMVDLLVLETSAARRVGSSPTFPTKFLRRQYVQRNSKRFI